jgi:hypothetical protein
VGFMCMYGEQVAAGDEVVETLLLLNGQSRKHPAVAQQAKHLSYSNTLRLSCQVGTCYSGVTATWDVEGVLCCVQAAVIGMSAGAEPARHSCRG